MPHATQPTPLHFAPCRFCSERAWLTLNPDFADDHFAHEPSGALVMEGPAPRLHSVDFIECLICGASAPAHVWNGAPVTLAMRAALVAEYTRDGSSEPQVALHPDQPITAKRQLAA